MKKMFNRRNLKEVQEELKCETGETKRLKCTVTKSQEKCLGIFQTFGHCEK